jgi:hypothetical protein
MVDYRLYIMDRKNHIHRRLDLACLDDAHAIAAACEHAGEDVLELWRRDRLVMRFEPQPFAPGLAAGPSANA